jgi:hypothetical protein
MRKLVSLEGLIDHLDQLGVLFFISLHVLIVVDVKHPLAVVLELNEGLVNLPSTALLFVEETFLEQEVFDGGLRDHVDIQVIESYQIWGGFSIAEIIVFRKSFQNWVQDSRDEKLKLSRVIVHDWLMMLPLCHPNI